jgi:hypothetical protein
LNNLQSTTTYVCEDDEHEYRRATSGCNLVPLNTCSTNIERSSTQTNDDGTRIGHIVVNGQQNKMHSAAAQRIQNQQMTVNMNVIREVVNSCKFAF